MTYQQIIQHLDDEISFFTQERNKCLALKPYANTGMACLYSVITQHLEDVKKTAHYAYESFNKLQWDTMDEEQRKDYQPIDAAEGYHDS